MKTGNLRIYCPKCASQNFSKKGFRKMAKNQKPLQQYQCKDCKHRFTANALRKTYRQRKPELNKKIMALYCEGMTLRGIGRVLKCSYDTVVAKFRFMAKLARDKHLKSISEGEIITTYVQFDEMISFEKNKNRKLGIELAIRPKTFQIISARVCEYPNRAANVKSTDQRVKMTDMMIEIDKCLNKETSTVESDGALLNIELTDKLLPDSEHQVHVYDKKKLWRINQVCGKLRQHLSRLKRKSWAVTQDRRFLQMHLDLFIAYQNGYKLEG